MLGYSWPGEVLSLQETVIIGISGKKRQGKPSFFLCNTRNYGFSLLPGFFPMKQTVTVATLPRPQWPCSEDRFRSIIRSYYRGAAGMLLVQLAWINDGANMAMGQSGKPEPQVLIGFGSSSFPFSLGCFKRYPDPQPYGNRKVLSQLSPRI